MVCFYWFIFLLVWVVFLLSCLVILLLAAGHLALSSARFPYSLEGCVILLWSSYVTCTLACFFWGLLLSFTVNLFLGPECSWTGKTWPFRGLYSIPCVLQSYHALADGNWTIPRPLQQLFSLLLVLGVFPDFGVLYPLYVRITKHSKGDLFSGLWSFRSHFVAPYSSLLHKF